MRSTCGAAAGSAAAHAARRRRRRAAVAVGRRASPAAAARRRSAVGVDDDPPRSAAAALSESIASLSVPPRAIAVDGEVEHDDDQQQHERGRVGLLGRVALAGRRVVVDVAGQRRAGAAADVRSRRRRRRSASCSVRAEQDHDDRGVAGDAAHAERRAGGDARAARPAAARGGSSPPSSCRARRRPRARGAGSHCSASRVAPTTSGSAISDIIAPAVRNERPKTAPPSAVKERKPKPLLLEDEQAEDREHDARRAGDDLDARLDRAREPRGPAVLGQPDRDRDAERRARSAIADDGQQHRADAAGPGSRRVLRLVELGAAGCSKSRPGRRYCSPATAM